MANVMLTSETAKDPNKPFKLRVEDVCTKFDVRSLRVHVHICVCACVLSVAVVRENMRSTKRRTCFLGACDGSRGL
jgi:hypothetical protein